MRDDYHSLKVISSCSFQLLLSSMETCHSYFLTFMLCLTCRGTSERLKKWPKTTQQRGHWAKSAKKFFMISYILDAREQGTESDFTAGPSECLSGHDTPQLCSPSTLSCPVWLWWPGAQHANSLHLKLICQSYNARSPGRRCKGLS